MHDGRTGYSSEACRKFYLEDPPKKQSGQIRAGIIDIKELMMLSV